MKDESQNIEDFNNNTVYEMSYDKDRIKYLKNEIKSIYGAEKGYTNIERAFGRYLMQNVALGTGNFEKNYLKLN